MSGTNIHVKTSSFRQHTQFIFLLILVGGLFGSLAFFIIVFYIKVKCTSPKMTINIMNINLTEETKWIVESTCPFMLNS